MKDQESAEIMVLCIKMHLIKKSLHSLTMINLD